MKLTIAALVTSLPLTVASGQAIDPIDAYGAQIAAAEKSLRLGETRELRRWLDACAPELRGWEWRHLNAIADTSTREIAIGEAPTRVEVSPRGDQLAIVDGNNVRIVSWPGLEQLTVVDQHGGSVYCATFSPDGDRLITVSRDVTSRTWDLASGSEIARIELSNPAVAACAFGPSGDVAATCAWERDEHGSVHGVVWVWDPATGTLHHRERVGDKPLSSIAFTPDGERIVVGSWDGLVHVLDAEGRELVRCQLPDEGVYNAVDDIAISPDSRHVAAASKDRTVRVFSVSTGELAATLRGHDGYVRGVTFSPDGARIATCSIDSTCAIWDTSTWQRNSVLRGAADSVYGLTWAGDSIIACADGVIRTWAAETNDSDSVDISIPAEGIYSTTFSGDDSEVAVACFDGWIRLCDARTGQERLAWEAHPGSTCHSAVFSGDGRRLITASWDKTARIWDPSTGANIAVLDAGDGVYAGALSHRGDFAATSGPRLRIWNVAEKKAIGETEVDGAQCTRLTFSPDGRRVASAWSDGYARIHSVPDGEELARLGTGGPAVNAAAFLPDGRIATGDAAGVVRVFGEDGNLTHSLDTGGRGVNQITCRADRIAVATDKLWLLDTLSVRPVLSISPHTDTIWDLSWSKDGSRIATCRIQGVIGILGR